MKLIVGSKSPRRKQLLEEMGYTFEIRVKETDESYPANLIPTNVACYIAETKAKQLKDDLAQDEVLLTADTIVCVDNVILGKPKTPEEAQNMLRLLSEKSHSVITAVSVATAHSITTESCETIVFVKELTLTEIGYYVQKYKPYDKAGGYGIQEWFGAIAIEKIEGSYNNVVGLPTHIVYQMLSRFEFKDI